MRLLANAAERARLASDQGGVVNGGTRYEAWVDPTAATVGDWPYRHGDELFGSGPKRLAGKLQRPVTVATVNGRLSGLSLELPRFRSAAFLPRFRGVESVSVEVSLSPSNGKLELRPPPCIAME